MTVAALALPDVTMARGTYPVPVAMPYVSGQEGVGVVTDAAPARRDLLGKRVAAVCIQPFGSLAPVSVGISTMFEVPDSMSDEDAAALHDPRAHRLARGAPARARSSRVRPSACSVPPAVSAPRSCSCCVAAGCDVLAVVGGAEKAAVVEELGARAVDHSTGDVVEASAPPPTGGAST